MSNLTLLQTVKVLPHKLRAKVVMLLNALVFQSLPDTCFSALLQAG
jgi:hypothetical protein